MADMMTPPRSESFHILHLLIHGWDPDGSPGVRHLFKALELRGGMLWGVDVAQMGDIHSWCIEQFGLPTDATWKRYLHEVTFMREDYAFAFKLRWC